MRRAMQTSTKSISPNFNPAAFANMQAEMLTQIQKELYGFIERSNRDWMARVQREVAVAFEITTKLSTAKSLSDVAKVCQEVMTRRTEIIIEDSQKLLANNQDLMNAAARIWSNGWQNGQFRGANV
jgi:hypothetical protein